MVRDIVIVGAGGFGREVVWTLERINAAAETWRILGYADDDPEKAGRSFDGYPVLGTVAQVAADRPGASAVVALCDNAARERTYAMLRGIDFPRIVDPTAVVAPTADLRHGVFIGPQAVVSVDVQVGKFAIVGARAGVGCDSLIGDFAQICPGVSIGARAKVAAGVFAAANVRDGETLSTSAAPGA